MTSLHLNTVQPITMKIGMYMYFFCGEGFCAILFVATPYRGRGSRMVKVWNRGWPCQEFEPSTTEEERCTLNLLRAQTSSHWCGVVVRRGGMPTQVCSTSLDHGSKLCGPSPKALV
ncbi:hypothetical protein TNCV_621521 [Trichonephila clavipes]|nr:hypothetical protein TNCV_621521 [Trichonephila clavipes]